MTSEPWRLVVAPSAERLLHRLPAKVAPAIVEFLTGPLLDNPERIGHPLQRDLVGLMSARRGTYRVVYEIDPASRTVRVVRIDHRADVYRPRG